MVENEFIFTSKDKISYLKGAKLFDTRLESVKNDKRKYDIIFEVIHDDFLIKLSSKEVSAKLLLYSERIKEIEFTKYRKYIEFSIYYEHSDHEVIVFQINTTIAEKLKAFLTLHGFSFIENIKVEAPTLMEKFRDKGYGSVYLIQIFLFAFFILVIYGLYCLFTTVDFSEIMSTGIIRFFIYIVVIVSLIIGAISRFK